MAIIILSMSFTSQVPNRPRNTATLEKVTQLSDTKVIGVCLYGATMLPSWMSHVLCDFINMTGENFHQYCCFFKKNLLRMSGHHIMVSLLS